jgi:CHASE2 domain-containing sensor protein/class 3 adenylate cyclase
MSPTPTPPSDDLERLASFQARHRAQLLAIVFTDMVGSTRLKQELGDTEALLRMREHHAIVRDVLRCYASGIEVNTQGDSFFLAFSTPSDSIRFALQLQSRLRKLNAERQWQIADRIGIHVGEVLMETRDDSGGVRDLNGLEVDTCARVMSLAEGGRILLTRSAYEMGRAALRGVRVEEVGHPRWLAHGAYQLKGVADPIDIYEVAEPGASELPPPADSEKARRVPVAGPATAARLLPWKTVWIGAAVVALVGILALGLNTPLTRLSYDLSYLTRPEIRPEEALIIAMDAQSHDELGQERGQRWSRKLHADLLRVLTPLGPRAIVLDTVMSTTNEFDGALVDAVTAATAAGVPVLIAAEVQRVREAGLAGVQVFPPFDALRDIARWGPARYVETGTARAVRAAVAGIGGHPTLATATVRAVSPESEDVARRDIWLNFYGRSGALPRLRYSEALQGEADPALVSNRVVLVGADYPGPFTAGGIQDHHEGLDRLRTPYSLFSEEETPGVEIVATDILNRLRRDFLRRLPGWLEALLVAAFGTAAMVAAARLRPLVGLGVTAALAIGTAALCSVLVWRIHVWFPWLVVCALQIPLAMAWSALARLEKAIPRSSPSARKPSARMVAAAKS